MGLRSDCDRIHVRLRKLGRDGFNVSQSYDQVSRIADAQLHAGRRPQGDNIIGCPNLPQRTPRNS